MGIFSFLTGKKDADPRGAAPQAAPDPGHEGPVAATSVNESPSDAGGSPATSATRGTSVVSAEPFDFAQGEPSAERRAPSAESPFHPPDAWNVDALTAPKPEVVGDKPEIGPVDPVVTAEFQPKIVETIKTVYDPEIPVDIYELGLIYGIDVDADRRVLVRMTLTSPACPSAQQIPSEVRYKVKAIPGVTDAWVEIEWEPPWDKDRMSEAAKLQLGFF